MKPIIMYVDDEPQNLLIFESSLPEDWTIHTYHTPMEALKKIEIIKPSIIVSDQRMPGVSGVEFLEIARKISPHAVRIIVTGYSDEDLIINSVRKAKIYDYIRKPWDLNDLESSLQKAHEHYYLTTENIVLLEKLREREAKLEESLGELRNTHEREMRLVNELKCWIPHFIIKSLEEESFHIPSEVDLVGITFDIIESSALHGLEYQTQPIRLHVLRLFVEAIIRNGGWCESLAGDSAYAHFGLVYEVEDPVNTALVAAREFRVSLRGLSEQSKVKIECGIAIHLAEKCTVNIHDNQLKTSRGIINQKYFDTTSRDIDLLHRMEKLAHGLPGSNIFISRVIRDRLPISVQGITKIGFFSLKGVKEPVEIWAVLSDKVDSNLLAQFTQKYSQHSS